MNQLELPSEPCILLIIFKKHLASLLIQSRFRKRLYEQTSYDLLSEQAIETN